MSAYRRAAALLVTGAALGALGACSSQGGSQEDPAPGDDPPLAVAPAPTSTAQASPAPTEEPGRNPQADPTVDPQGDPQADPEPDDAPAPGPSSGPGGAAPTDAANACRSTQLIGAEADQILGNEATKVLFVFRTTDPAGCTLQGYPAVTLLDATGGAVPVSVNHGGLGLSAGAATAHDLGPQDSLSFFLAVPLQSGGGCSAITTVRVELPTKGGSVDIASDFTVCAGSVAVTPFQALAQSGQIGR